MLQNYFICDFKGFEISFITNHQAKVTTVTNYTMCRNLSTNIFVQSARRLINYKTNWKDFFIFTKFKWTSIGQKVQLLNKIINGRVLLVGKVFGHELLLKNFNIKKLNKIYEQYLKLSDTV